MNKPIDPEYLSLRQCQSEILKAGYKLGIASLRNMAKDGSIQAIKRSNEWLISPSSLQEYILEKDLKSGIVSGHPYYLGVTLRVSNGEPKRLELQERRLLKKIRTYCQNHDIYLSDSGGDSNLIIGRDIMEAKKLHRRYGLKKILRCLASGKLRFWFVEHTDRLSKGVFDVYELIARTFGCKLVAFDRVGKSRVYSDGIRLTGASSER